jgi:hypothetical protein
MQPTNYVKLSIRCDQYLADGDAVCVPWRNKLPHLGDSDGLYVTTWIFSFVGELPSDARRALAAAEAKCDALAAAYGLAPNQFSFTTWRPSVLPLDVVRGIDESEAA